MFIDADSVDKLTEWLFDSGEAHEGDLDLLNELVTRIRDDSWRGRWWSEQDFATGIHGILLRRGLRVQLVEELVADHEWAIVIVDIRRVPDDYGDDPWAFD
jgi:hypothetical protein